MNHNYHEFINILTNVCIKENHRNNDDDGILLSGGLDSSILAYHTRAKDSITVTIDKSSPDYFYSSLIAKKKYSVNHHQNIIPFKEILTNIEELVKDFKTFDPIFLKNSVVQLIGFKIAKKLKINSLVLGDGGDELFAGYNFLHQYINEPKKINQKIDSIFQNMDFISIKLAKKLGLKIFLPFLDKEIMDFSHTILLEEKISKYNGTLFGKFFLRKCYEDILGKEIVWRRKTALENGSGVTNLKYYIDNNVIADYDFIKEIKKARLEEGVEIRNKEHLYFYKMYRKFFKPPKEENSAVADTIEISVKKCPHCNTIFSWHGNFCKICGAFPVHFNHENKRE